MEKLTRRQNEVLGAIRSFAAGKGYAPTVRELAGLLGIDARAAYDHLLCLERKGVISRERGKSRTVSAVSGGNAAPGMMKIPVLGRVPAGGPLLVPGNVLETVGIESGWLGRGEFFMLEVSGDSMAGAHIKSGDYVIVRVQPYAEQGDIVVALVDGEATVKRFFRRKGYAVLAPENPDYEPIKVKGDLQIAGKVTGLIRRY